ncbi:hypothetical protein AX17_001817 [Amanita inopinata Kibby_2008]|nr:hypothetical protein AX17_001817 [Amanita inopinata Kibby_2008]
MIGSSFILFLLSTFLSMSFVVSVPLKREEDSTADIRMLNFALMMEHISSEMYSDGLAKYTQQDFLNAGLPEFTYGRFQEIAEHENTHVKFLTAAISDAGAQPVPKCTYQFPHDNVQSFVQLALTQHVTETSTYSGSVAFMHDKRYTSMFASILGVESRHASWIDSAVRKFNPWSGAFETPLSSKHSYSLASAYVTSCPESFPLSLEAFPPLTFDSAPVPGQRVVIEFDMPNASEHDAQGEPEVSHMWVAFLTGEGIKYAMIHNVDNDGCNSYEVVIPDGLVGLVYAVVTKSDRTMSDDTTVAGPTLLMFHYNSQGILE